MLDARGSVDANAVDVHLSEILAAVLPAARRRFAKFGVRREDSEDLLQDVLVVYLVKAEAIANPVAWILGALERQCLAFLRHRQRSRRHVDASLIEFHQEASAHSPVQAALWSEVVEAIESLPRASRNVLHLLYVEERDRTDVAVQLGFANVESVRAAERRAISRLAASMGRAGRCCAWAAGARKSAGSQSTHSY